MPDVDMPDIPAPASAKAKTSKAGPSGDSASDGKKRFEVKKVMEFDENIHETLGRLTDGSGMLWLCGLGISWSTTVPSAEITSWTFVRYGCYSYEDELLNSDQVSNVKRTKHPPQVKSAQLLGVYAMHA